MQEIKLKFPTFLIARSEQRKTNLIFQKQPSQVFCKKGVLRNIAKFTGKHLCQSLFFIKVAGLMLCHRCFSVNFAKFLTTPFLQNTSGRLLLIFNFFEMFLIRLVSVTPIRWLKNVNCKWVPAYESFKHDVHNFKQCFSSKIFVYFY